MAEYEIVDMEGNIIDTEQGRDEHDALRRFYAKSGFPLLETNGHEIRAPVYEARLKT